MHVREHLRSRRTNTAWPGIPMYSSRSFAGWPAASSTRNVNIVRRFGTSGVSSRTQHRSWSGREHGRPADHALSSPVSGAPLIAGSRAAPVTVSDTPVACTRSANSSYLPGGHFRQPLLERAGRDFVRVEMPQAIERRRHDEQVHQVAVVGDEVVQPAAAQSSRDRAASSRERPSDVSAGVASSGL